MRPGHWHFKTHFSDSNVQARDENYSSRGTRKKPRRLGLPSLSWGNAVEQSYTQAVAFLRAKRKCKSRLVKWLMALLNSSWISVRFLAYSHSVSAWLPPGMGNSLPIKAGYSMSERLWLFHRPGFSFLRCLAPNKAKQTNASVKPHSDLGIICAYAKVLNKRAPPQDKYQ